MYILGINGTTYWAHDPAAVLLEDGRIVAAVEEERILRVKHAVGWLPLGAIRTCLKIAGISIQDVDVIAYYTNTYKGIREKLTRFFNFHLGHCPELAFIDHHEAHASSTFRASGFNDTYILSIDNTGDAKASLLAYGKKGEIEKFKYFPKGNSLGLFYGLATQFLGFRMHNDEFKVMGLASYGEPRYDTSKLLRVTNDGYELAANIELNQPYGRSASNQERRFSDLWADVFGEPRLHTEKITQRHADIASSIQKKVNECALNLLRILSENFDSKNLCMAGGVSLNCVMNAALYNSGYIDNIFIQPAANDPGTALGAAMEVAAQNDQKIAKLEHVYLGPEFSEKEIMDSLELCRCRAEYYADIEGVVAEKLAAGKIIGWFQGRMEFGPRALGNRSILADPTHVETKDKINALVKFRENFRPFAPSVTLEDTKRYFENSCESPYMTLVFKVKRPGEIPAVTHADNTARIQTVRKKVNPKYYRLIKEFEKETSLPVVLNTSLNIKGRPIVCTPREALETFYGTGMDCLALGNYLIEK